MNFKAGTPTPFYKVPRWVLNLAPGLDRWIVVNTADVDAGRIREFWARRGDDWTPVAWETA